jgi:hypothetical protein
MAGVLGVSAPWASATTTLVDCGADSTALQPAINAAEADETLEIIGTCVGNFVIDRDLVLQGTGTLDGNDAGTVVETTSQVTIVDLIITNGRGSIDTFPFSGQGSGGGIFNRGHPHLERISHHHREPSGWRWRRHLQRRL